MSRAISQLTLADNRVIIREHGSSHVTVANILGRETRNGQEYIWLDRLIHHSGIKAPAGWEMTGAISTILISAPANVQ